jgi:outer membrane protein assembly factor BamB
MDIAPQQSARKTLPLVILGAYWCSILIAWLIEMPYFFRFLFSMAAPALLLIVFSIWWWLTSRITRGERVLGFLALIASPFAAAPLTDASMGLPQTLMMGTPLAITALALWVLFSPVQAGTRRLAINLLVIGAAYIPLMLLQMEGLDGDLRAALRPRWSETAEDRFLNEMQHPSPSPPATTAEPLVASDGDWTEFRGPNRDGVLIVDAIAQDWNDQPPKLLWKQRIGPAWSSVIVVGNRLFTQEQRGDQETIVAYDAGTGNEIWVHQDETRFYEAVSGPGPRSTPTFADGRIYMLGATGILNCLDAVTGQRHWSHDLQKEMGAVVPMWGISSSPLVRDGLAISYVGGEGHHNLVAYHAESGQQAWTSAAGDASYSSPQYVTIAGIPQILMFNDLGLLAVDPSTGKELWKGGLPMPGAPRTLQAHLLDGKKLLAGTLNGMGTGMIEIQNIGDQWKLEERWSTQQLRPEFSDIVVYKGHAYGFDGAILCCIDLESGNRRWKGGRYGRGQLVLLANQGLLLVLSETGDAALVAAQPEKYQELAKFTAITGKTWNHPVIAHGNLFVRNAEEIACYELRPAQSNPIEINPPLSKR